MFLFRCGELGDIIYLDEMCCQKNVENTRSADRVNIKLQLVAKYSKDVFVLTNLEADDYKCVVI